jgi:predicted CXXCH cytochrome family protein
MGRIIKPVIVVVILLLVLAIPALAVVARSYILAPVAQPAKAQPIAFPHSIHVNVVGLDCTFCHRGATTQADSTVPALQLCMGCHAIISTTDRPQLEKLVNAFNSGTPINWARVHQLPDHVHFGHAMHINAGFSCATCHGDVASMAPGAVVQVRDLRMGDCITCHRENNAPTDCSTCHY